MAAGDRLGAYEIVGLCGRGGMGAVFEAYDPRLDRRVAIKVVLPRLAGMAGHQRLLTEARELARITHPNVVTVYEVEEHDDSVYLVMELVEGPSLGAWAEASGRSLETLLPVLSGVAEGLAAAHRGGIVHRDVKPSNIVVGEEGRPRVIDFGLALSPSVSRGRSEAVSSSGEESGGRGGRPRLVGTPAYMAPELLGGGSADARSDLFSLAVTAYEVLHGRRPFDVFAGVDAAELRAAIEAGPQGRWRSDLPGPLRRLLLSGLALDPAARPSLEAFALGLRLRRGAARGMLAGLTATAALGGALAFGLGAGAQNAVDPLCSPEAAAAEVAESWNPELRAALDERYKELEVVDGGRIVASMARELDRRVEEWEVLHAELCETLDSSGAMESAEEGERLARAGVRTARLACLDLRLAEIDGLVELLLNGDRELLALGPRFLDELHDIDHCRRQDFADVEAPLPEEGAARTEAMAVRGLMIQARVLSELGQRDEARAVGQEALARARELGIDGLIAEAELVLGTTHPEEYGRVPQAAYLAAACGARRTYAFAAIVQAAHLGLGGDDRSGAEIWLGHAESTMAVLGEDPEVEGLYAWIKGALALRGGRLTEARPHLERAVKLYRQTHGEDALAVVTQPLRTLALVERGLGEPARALELVDGALATVEARLGPHTSLLVPLRLDRAGMLLDLGRLEEVGRAHRELALALENPVESATYGRTFAEQQLRLAEALGESDAAAASALALAVAAAGEGDELGEALARSTRAHHLLRLGDEGAAVEELERARAIEARIYTAHELAGRDQHRRLRALLIDAYREASLEDAARALEARSEEVRLRVLREFSLDGFAGAEVCLQEEGPEAAEGSPLCVITDNDGQAVFPAPRGWSAASLRVRAAGVVPTLLSLGGDLGGAYATVSLYTEASVERVAGYLRAEHRPGLGVLMVGVEGPYVDGVAGAKLDLRREAGSGVESGSESGSGPYYLTELGAFDRDRTRTSRNSRGGVGWLGLSAGRYEVVIDHPLRDCTAAEEARAGSFEGSVRVVIEPGVLTRAPDFRCAALPSSSWPASSRSAK